MITVRLKNKAVLRGKQGYLAGKVEGDNPYIHLSKYKSLAAWWEVGYNEARSNNTKRLGDG